MKMLKVVFERMGMKAKTQSVEIKSVVDNKIYK